MVGEARGGTRAVLRPVRGSTRSVSDVAVEDRRRRPDESGTQRVLVDQIKAYEGVDGVYLPQQVTVHAVVGTSGGCQTAVNVFELAHRVHQELQLVRRP